MERFSNPNSILAFVTVAREGSVSRAAELLNLTQPAVSHQIRRLSEDIGITLFTRTSRGLDLTADAKSLLPKAEQVLDAMTEFRRCASLQCGQVNGTLRLGTIIDPEFIRLGRLLSQLGAAHPNITTELVHGVSGEILEKIQRRQVDAGFYLAAPDQFHALGEGGVLPEIRFPDERVDGRAVCHAQGHREDGPVVTSREDYLAEKRIRTVAFFGQERGRHETTGV